MHRSCATKPLHMNCLLHIPLQPSSRCAADLSLAVAFAQAAQLQTPSLTRNAHADRVSAMAHRYSLPPRNTLPLMLLLFIATLTLAAVRATTEAVRPAVTSSAAEPSNWGQGQAQGPSAGLSGAVRWRPPLAPSRRLLQLDCRTVQLETVQGCYCLSFYDQTLGKQPYLWPCDKQDKAQHWLWCVGGEAGPPWPRGP